MPPDLERGDSFSEPGLLEDLRRRVEEAEQQYKAQDLDLQGASRVDHQIALVHVSIVEKDRVRCHLRPSRSPSIRLV